MFKNEMKKYAKRVAQQVVNSGALTAAKKCGRVLTRLILRR